MFFGTSWEQNFLCTFRLIYWQFAGCEQTKTKKMVFLVDTNKQQSLPLLPPNCFRNKSHLWSKISDMSFFLLQRWMRDKHWEVTILNSQLLDFPVKEFLDALPDWVGPRAQDVTATHIIIFDQLRFCDNLQFRILDCSILKTNFNLVYISSWTGI